MFTDLVGSTARWESDPDGMRDALAHHDAAAVTSIESHGGRLIKRTGDGTFSVFTDAQSAVEAALEIQDRDGASSVKIAIHTASIEPTGDDYVGPPVNKLARILDQAVGGQTVLSNAATALADVDGVGAVLEPLGEHPLRDIELHEHLWLVRTPETRSVPSRRRTHGRLERELIGRADDSRTLTSRIGQHRLVSIVGPGGVGKTSLAIEHLATVPTDTSVGVIDLTAVSNGNFAHAVASQLGAARFDDVARRLAVGSWLVVFDNCEHVLDQAAAAVGSLLSGVPGLRVIATSREPLGVVGEVLIRLAPLDTSGSNSPASELFARLALERGVSLESTDEDVVELVRALDGLPLALELAAARTAAFSPREILARLSAGGIEVLDRRRGGGDRHSGLAATIEWSIGLLDSRAANALEALSAFTGPFSTEMAVMAIGEPIGESMDLLADLVERSLVHRDLDAERSSFRLLEMVRLVAAARLAERGAQNEVWARISDAVASRLVDIGTAPIWSTMEAPYLLDEGFHVAERVVESAIADQRPSGTLLAMVRGFWALEDYGHRGRGAQLLRQAIERSERRSEDLAVALGCLSMLARMMGEEEEAERAAMRAVQLDSGSGGALGRRTLGLIARSHHRWDEAVEHFETAIELARNAGERPLETEATVHLSMTFARAGHVAAAIEMIEPLAEADDRAQIHQTLVPLFLAWFLMRDDRRRARALSAEVLKRTTGTRDLWSIATASYQIAILDMFEGEFASAAAHLHRTIDLFTSTLARGDMILALYAASGLFLSCGMRGEAVTAYHAGEVHNPRLGDFEREILAEIGFDPSLEYETPEATGPRSLLEPLERIATGIDGAPRREPTARNRLTKHGSLWTVSYGQRQATVADSKGLRDIATLVRRPREEIAAVELAGVHVAAGGLETSDRSARTAYRERLRELQSTIDDADTAGDLERAATARTEFDAIVAHLSSAFGLSGAPRSSGRPDERARSAVTSRIRAAIKKMRNELPEFAEHLDQSIKTGRFCVYDPAEPTQWVVDES